MGEFEALTLEAQPFGVLIAAAEIHNVAAEGAQAFHVFALVHIVAQATSGHGIPGGDEGGQMVGHRPLPCLGEFAGLGDESAGLGEGGLFDEPGAVGALLPTGEVSFG